MASKSPPFLRALHPSQACGSKHAMLPIPSLPHDLRQMLHYSLVSLCTGPMTRGDRGTLVVTYCSTVTVMA